ncbi:MAG: histidine--tRNA ligase [Acidimicrobiales bacterium]
MNGPSAVRAPVGTHDVLAPDSARWQYLIATFANWARRYDFSLIINPLFEDVAVFNRGIGEASEMATKEMYVFADRGGRTLALRPEGTASVVRAFVQHRPSTPFKAWYVTPAFRYERPQKGRYRQHHQLGVEALGTDDPSLDVEVISLAWRFYAALGLTRVRLLINSMGHPQCRGAYVAVLTDYLTAHEAEICDEHRETWRANPLRVLDCKKDACVALTTVGPMLIDHLCHECATHFAQVRSGLEAIGIASELNPRLVRGFDYYTRTTFEFVSDALESAQNAVGGGGRYDTLVEQLGGPPTSGIGFGSGIERLLLVLEAEGVTVPVAALDAFVVDTCEEDATSALVDELRRAGLSVGRAYDARSMKAQMKAADRSGARYALLVGPREQVAGEVTMRDLRGDESAGQVTLSREAVVAHVTDLVKKRL